MSARVGGQLDKPVGSIRPEVRGRAREVNEAVAAVLREHREVIRITCLPESKAVAVSIDEKRVVLRIWK